MSSVDHHDVARLVRDSIAVKNAVLQDSLLLQAIASVAKKLALVLEQGGKLLLAGNGGSAADAQHIASELVGQLNTARPGIAALALTTDTSALTSVANDYGFEQVYSRQVETLGRRGDVFLAVSTSGNSPNILAALRSARQAGLFTVALTGASGGAARELCDVCLQIPSDDTPRIQESHILVGHTLCALVEGVLYPEPC